MAKTAAKTVPTTSDLEQFISTIADEQKQQDTRRIASLMQEATGFPPVLWGSAIIGFGSYHYRYDSGHEGDAPLVGFSPRKANIALYIANYTGKDDQLEKLGKHTMAKSCVYIKKLSDVSETVLKEMSAAAARHCQEMYPR